MTTAAIPQEPSHVFLRARLGIEWFEWWHDATLDEQTEIKAVEEELKDLQQAVSWGAADLDVSDAELLARRAVWRPFAMRRRQLQEDRNVRWRAAYDEFERRNPKPKRGTP